MTSPAPNSDDTGSRTEMFNDQRVNENVPSSQETKDSILLARLGYKSEFKREFSMVQTIAFSVSCMGVAGAIPIVIIFPLVSGGHFGLVWGWFIGSAFIMCIALSLSELVSSMPTSAGLYYFSAKLAPPRYSALCSWITAWANITGQIALLCSIDYTCAQMITTAIAIGSDGHLIVNSGATYGLFIAILVAHGCICSAATGVLAKMNVYFIVLNIGTALAEVIILFAAAGSRVPAKDAFIMFDNNTGWRNDGWAFIFAFTAPMWVLIGYDSAAHISEEVNGATRTAPIAILSAVIGSAILGWLILVASSFAIQSVPDLLATPLPLPMGQLLLTLLGKKGMLALWSFVILVQLGTGAAQGIDASRVVFAFARDRALPGSKYWKQFNTRTQTPVNAVWFVMAAAAVMGFLGFSETALTSFAGATVVSLYCSYIIPIFLRSTSGREKFVPGWFSLGRWSAPIAIVGIVWVLFICLISFFPPGTAPSATDMNYAVVLIAAVASFAAGSWILSARKWFTGPVKTVVVDESPGTTWDTNQGRVIG